MRPTRKRNGACSIISAQPCATKERLSSAGMSQQINLFNPIFLAQKKYFSAAAMLQALALLVGGLILAHVFAVHQTGALERLLADSVREAGQRREQLVALAKQSSDQSG